MPRLEPANRFLFAQGQPDIVQTVQQAMLAEAVDLERVLHAIRSGHGLRRQVDGQRVAIDGLALREQRIDLVGRQHDRQQAVLETVVVENVGEARRDDRAEAVFLQRPWRVFPRGAAAEVLAGQQHAGALVARRVEDELRVERPHAVVAPGLADVEVAPFVEQVRSEAGALDRLQELLGDDLVGVDIGAVERTGQAGVGGEGFHRNSQARIRSRTSTKWPATAAAAAIAGLTRCVRPPVPWRPSKLRLDVEAQCSPAPSLSGFIARHIEQPGSRHSKPASRKMRSSPSASACALTRPEPGTTSACFTLAATLRPLATSAAARRSSIRELVHEPMNTRSSLIVVIGWFACRPMYFSARWIESFRTGSCSRSGSGTFWSTASTISGDVPQLTCGLMSSARSSTRVSKCASSSDTSVRHTATAASQSAPFGANGRPRT